MPVTAHHDETGESPVEEVEKAWEAGLCNTEIPEAYGGLGLGVFESCLIAGELGFGCTGITTAIEANNHADAPLVGRVMRDAIGVRAAVTLRLAPNRLRWPSAQRAEPLATELI